MRVQLEQAISTYEVAGSAPDMRAEAQRLLVEAQWPEPRERARARPLARRARP
ncbi:MAG: hypothetical protein AAGF11_22610 [Myxococcota bacterium]